MNTHELKILEDFIISPSSVLNNYKRYDSGYVHRVISKWLPYALGFEFEYSPLINEGHMTNQIKHEKLKKEIKKKYRHYYKYVFDDHMGYERNSNCEYRFAVKHFKGLIVLEKYLAIMKDWGDFHSQVGLHVHVDTGRFRNESIILYSHDFKVVNKNKSPQYDSCRDLRASTFCAKTAYKAAEAFCTSSEEAQHRINYNNKSSYNTVEFRGRDSTSNISEAIKFAIFATYVVRHWEKAYNYFKKLDTHSIDAKQYIKIKNLMSFEYEDIPKFLLKQQE